VKGNFFGKEHAMKISVTQALTTTLVSALGVAGLTLSAGQAQAITINPVPHSIVRYDDLNLRSDAGAETLYARVNRAAEKVCDRNDWSDFSETYHRVLECEQTAIANAISQVHSPNLTAIYNRHFPNAASRAAATPAVAAQMPIAAG
jgi:UrcA family protein